MTPSNREQREPAHMAEGSGTDPAPDQTRPVPVSPLCWLQWNRTRTGSVYTHTSREDTKEPLQCAFSGTFEAPTTASHSQQLEGSRSWLESALIPLHPSYPQIPTLPSWFSRVRSGATKPVQWGQSLPVAQRWWLRSTPAPLNQPLLRSIPNPSWPPIPSHSKPHTHTHTRGRPAGPSETCWPCWIRVEVCIRLEAGTHTVIFPTCPLPNQWLHAHVELY